MIAREKITKNVLFKENKTVISAIHCKNAQFFTWCNFNSQQNQRSEDKNSFFHHLFRKCGKKHLQKEHLKVGPVEKDKKKKKTLEWFNTLFFSFQLCQVNLESILSLKEGADCW